MIPDRAFPVRVWLVALLGWIFDFYDLILLSFLLAPIGGDLHLVSSEEALLLGAALGASGIGGVVFGLLADRHGRKPVMVATIALYSLGTLLCAFAPDFRFLLAFRVVTGLGVGGEWAVGHALLAEAVAPRFRGRASALLQLGEPVGVALAATVGLLLLPVLGWRGVFLVSSASGLLALLARGAVRESRLWQQAPRTSAWRTFREQRLWGRAFAAWMLATLKLGTYWTCYIWLPLFLQQRMHLSLARSVFWIVAAQAGQLLGMLAFGWAADSLGRRLAFCAYSLLTAAAIFPLAAGWSAVAPHPWLFWGLFFALGFGSGCTAGFGALFAELFPTAIRNAAMGTCYNLARGVQFFAPIAVSALAGRFGLAGGLGLPVVLALATAAWVWVFPETRGIALGERSVILDGSHAV